MRLSQDNPEYVYCPIYEMRMGILDNDGQPIFETDINLYEAAWDDSRYQVVLGRDMLQHGALSITGKRSTSRLSFKECLTD